MSEIIKGKIIELGKVIEYGLMPRRVRIARVEYNDGDIIDAISWGKMSITLKKGMIVSMVKTPSPVAGVTFKNYTILGVDKC